MNLKKLFLYGILSIYLSTPSFGMDEDPQDKKGSNESHLFSCGNFDNLGGEILYTLLDTLPAADIMTLMQTCKGWQNLAGNYCQTYKVVQSQCFDLDPTALVVSIGCSSQSLCIFTISNHDEAANENGEDGEEKEENSITTFTIYNGLTGKKSEKEINGHIAFMPNRYCPFNQGILIHDRSHGLMEIYEEEKGEDSSESAKDIAAYHIAPEVIAHPLQAIARNNTGIIIQHEYYEPLQGAAISVYKKGSEPYFVKTEFGKSLANFGEKFLASVVGKILLINPHSDALIEKTISLPESRYMTHMTGEGNKMIMSCKQPNHLHNIPTDYYLIEDTSVAEPQFSLMPFSPLPQDYHPIGLALKNNLLFATGLHKDCRWDFEQKNIVYTCQENGIFQIYDLKNQSVCFHKTWFEQPIDMLFAGTSFFISLENPDNKKKSILALNVKRWF